MTAYVRTGAYLAKRRRVLGDAECGLRAAITHGTVTARHVERVRDAQLGYLKALCNELQPGTEVDEAATARLAWAAEAERAWRAAAPRAIVAAYAAGRSILPGHVPATFAPDDNARS